jgi:hypothetical protein
MYDRTLAIYCFVDDLLKAMHHAEDRRAEFSDAEVMTTAVVAMLCFGGNFAGAPLPAFFRHDAADAFSLAALAPPLAARRPCRAALS